MATVGVKGLIITITYMIVFGVVDSLWTLVNFFYLELSCLDNWPKISRMMY